MRSTSSWLPFLDLAGYRSSAFHRDVLAALTVTFLSVPQAVAYALIAGLPPVMGLYAACVPTIVGAIFRSSRHVITGPSNALSLLVGEALAAQAGLDPIPTALLLAFLIGVLQLGAGVLRLGVVVDYISTPVVVGYIAGAGVLIAIGQLPNLTGTVAGHGDVLSKLSTWFGGLADANAGSIAIGLGAAAVIVGLRRLDRRIPAAIIALSAATGLSFAIDLEVMTIADLASIPAGLPPFSMPTLDGWSTVMSLAIAGAVLSLVESSSVARAASATSGQRLDLSTEFIGQGLANIAAALSGGYPTSGSLARTAVNQRSGARTRMSGVFAGLLMLGVLLALGPVVDHTPIAALAGLLFVIAYDLIDRRRIARIIKARPGDVAAFVATVVGTWSMPLDKAIYLGVAISLIMFLRRARMLVIRRTVLSRRGRLREIEPDEEPPVAQCLAIRALQVEGQLFFGSSGELQASLDSVVAEQEVLAVVVRIKRAHGLDYTTLGVLLSAAETLRSHGRHLILVGLQSDTLDFLRRTGAADELGEDNLFASTPRWFESMNDGLRRAVSLVGSHSCAACPVAAYVAEAAKRRPGRGAETTP